MNRRSAVLALLTLGPLAAAESPAAYTLVIYTADWCEVCRRLAAAVEAHPEVLRGAAVEWRDAAELGDLNVRVPDLRVYRGERPVARMVGYRGLEPLAQWLSEVIK